MKSEVVTYSMGELTAAGVLVYDEKVSRKRPAVLMAPNWLGLTELAIERAKLVAGDRYVVFVADMYGQGTRPADFNEAAALANPLRENAAEQRQRIRSAYNTMLDKAGKYNLIDHRAPPLASASAAAMFWNSPATERISLPPFRSMAT